MVSISRLGVPSVAFRDIGGDGRCGTKNLRADHIGRKISMQISYDRGKIDSQFRSLQPQALTADSRGSLPVCSLARLPVHDHGPPNPSSSKLSLEGNKKRPFAIQGRWDARGATLLE